MAASLKEIKTVLETFEQTNKGSSLACSVVEQLPQFPKENTSFLYSCRNPEDADYLLDGYMFANQGNNGKSSNQLVQRTYYQLCSPSDPSIRFFKHVNRLKEPLNVARPAVFIQYFGDSSAAVLRPHGNSRKRKKPYIRASKDLLAKIKNNFRVYKKPKQTYTELLEETSVPQAPHNIKQVRNIYHHERFRFKILRDEIFSVVEFARQSGFCRLFQLVPSLAIIVADLRIFEICANLISNKSSFEKFIFAYDTTFCIGDYYLSYLVSRNTYFENDPVFPVAYMVHEKKTVQVHSLFWNYLAATLDLADCKIVVDREPAISKAILSAAPTACLVYCYNHLLQNVNRFFVGNKTCSLSSACFAQLKDDIVNLIYAPSRAQFDALYDACVSNWTKISIPIDFIDYFEKNLKSDIVNSASNASGQRLAGMTTNIIEGFNRVIKDLNFNQETPIDLLVLRLFQQQLFYLYQFSVETSGCFSGNYQLKAHVVTNGIQVPTFDVSYLSLETIVGQLKEHIVVETPSTSTLPKHSIEMVSGTYRMTQSTIADMCHLQNLVSYDCKTNCFVVKSPLDGACNTVQRIESNVLQCSCPSSGRCFHRLAVEKSNAAIASINGSYKLSSMRKNSRPKKLKCGRKKPSLADYAETS